MCRIAVSINTGEVSAHDVTRMISRDGRPTALGESARGPPPGEPGRRHYSFVLPELGGRPHPLRDPEGPDDE